MLQEHILFKDFALQKDLYNFILTYTDGEGGTYMSLFKVRKVHRRKVVRFAF